MNEGDVVLVSLPQADGQVKPRPALVLRKMPPYQDLLFCGISSQLYHEVKGFDDVIDVRDSDFSKSGLRTTSLVRLSFLAVLPVKDVFGTLGSIDANRHQTLLRRLTDYLADDIA